MASGRLVLATLGCSVSVSGEEIRGLEEHGALDSWCNQII